MDELVEFLRARLTEDEQTARAAIAELDGPSGADWQYDRQYVETVRERTMVAVGSQDFMEPGVGVHIARHDPARVLREIDAKRQIIEQHTVSETSEFEGKTDTITYCPICRNDGECPTLRLLALPYADHPDYRQEWRP
ncbi:DUF6221 family protein [Streptomyces spinosus]|uniref:DUF6221 family protein n=1 Tax=Streptomyces spinosus TaxID=2872623 RepID=UPI001CECDD47|nr:DUF6221 family protein [Streptomyces spinosus]